LENFQIYGSYIWIFLQGNIQCNYSLGSHVYYYMVHFLLAYFIYSS